MTTHTGVPFATGDYVIYDDSFEAVVGAFQQYLLNNLDDINRLLGHQVEPRVISRHRVSAPPPELE